ncbi:MAG: sulfur carrier protein ThiS [Gemmatimonadetes bacterium]|nr:sulfur carrier protein ThiS [Gemmatimonadota bacterium]MXX13215.1 sulfur carrier protein ThiS [Gemmatimonadota bacterium]MXZ07943.1 sulfur carrier protein ThiS [Gemmatimonadota bacterium]MYB57286.1 sulfur carrier protein ThiS [Gemmatimonadota bacterium]MYC15191.1 sulfur carrier protein ThiS [Gemmatimonadota bacterium]
MQLIVNGQEQSVDDASTLLDLLIEMNFKAEQKGIAVAVNAEVIARAIWADMRLRNGDRVDIIHAVQGG